MATLHRYYVGRRDLIVLAIDPERLAAEVIYEDLTGSGVEFPHVYGPIELAAVRSATPLTPDADGRFDHWRPDDPTGSADGQA